MRKLTTILLAVAAVINVQTIKAQTADEIIDKHISAMGGKEKLLSLKSVKKTGSLYTEGVDVGITVTLVQGIGSRNDISVPGMGEGFQIINATKGWNFMPFQGQNSPEEVSENDLKLSQHLLDLQGLLVNYKEKGSQVELLGKENVDSAQCFKLKIITKDGNVYTQFIDGNTWYIVKSTAKTITESGEENTETGYGDFKKTAEGFVFPFSQIITRGTIKFSSIEVNKPVDEKIFTFN